MKAIDIHAHIFSRVNGRNAQGAVVSERYGRVRNGDVTRPFMPPLSDSTSFTAENLLELMAGSEVEKALLLQNPTIGCMNGEIMDTVMRYPGIFAGVIQVDPFKADAVEQMIALADTGRFRALKLEMSDDWGWLSIHPLEKFHYKMIYPLIEAAQSRKLHVIFDTGATTGGGYLVDELRSLIRDFPGVHFVVEHLGYMTPQGDREKHEAMLYLGQMDHVSFGISAMGQLMAEAYPCAHALEVLKHAYMIMGAEKLMWGSDCPTTLNRYTYQQMKDVVELHADFLSVREKELILYENGDALFFR